MQEGMTTSSEETNQSDVTVPTNGSKSEGAAGTSLDLAEQGGATKTALALNPPEPPARQATGSRTKIGKKRASQNATKQGIVSAVTVLEGESRAKYESLLRGLWEAFQPEGKLEKILVEKLATLLWRHRRLIVAESAEIQKNTQFLQWDQSNQQQREAEEIGSSSVPEYNGGLIRKIPNPLVLRRCLDLLAQLRQGIETDGFDPEWDPAILERIYGERDTNHMRKTLYDEYAAWLAASGVSEEERQREGYPTPERRKQNVLDEVDAEIRRLERYRKTRDSIEADRMKLEKLRRSVPDSPSLDRLLRYEASLERAFDRTLSQLERLQRIRLGQPVPPTVHVNLSS